MSAQYKMRNRLSENESGIVHVTILTEKHLFIDRSHAKKLNSAADGIEGIDELLSEDRGIHRLLEALGPETPSTVMLGLETEWRDISEAGAEELVTKYYTANPQFNVYLEGSAHSAALVISAGKASVRVPLNAAQAADDKAKIEALKEYCEAHQPKTDAEAKQAIEAIVGVGTVSSTILKIGTTCVEGAPFGPLVGVTACLGSIALSLGTFLGFVKEAKDKQERQREMRDRERVCSSRTDMAGGGDQGANGSYQQNMLNRPQQEFIGGIVLAKSYERLIARCIADDNFRVRLVELKPPTTSFPHDSASSTAAPYWRPVDGVLAWLRAEERCCLSEARTESLRACLLD